MKTLKWKKWALVLATGAVTLQAASCAETATIVSGWADAITAGSVVILVREILM